MPSLGDALSDKNVTHVLRSAWDKTQAENIEVGGWIFHDGKAYGAKQTTDNSAMSVTLTRSSDLQKLSNVTILAQYHCHPGNTKAASKPSPDDIKNARDLSYPSLVFTYDNGIDPSTRAMPRPTPDNFPADTIMWQIG